MEVEKDLKSVRRDLGMTGVNLAFTGAFGAFTLCVLGVSKHLVLI